MGPHVRYIGMRDGTGVEDVATKGNLILDFWSNDKKWMRVSGRLGQAVRWLSNWKLAHLHLIADPGGNTDWRSLCC